MTSSFPYNDIQPHQHWKSAVSALSPGRVDPQIAGRFRISRTTRVASAGSCFARRIADGLRAFGFNYLVTEPGPRWLDATARAEYGYGVYSARYGEIYTTLQLVQLLERALGEFEPEEDYWKGPGGFVDPFRPRIQPEGFSTVEEMRSEREGHLRAVRQMVEEAEVLVFTLGLTETWRCAADGAALPMCPGRKHGAFDPERYVFSNLSLSETVEALERFLDLALSINPGLRFLLTVSPVPLVATMEERHVLSSTVYSKSVLRVAAEEVRCRRQNVDYFASYEIVTATGNRYFEEDRRTVADAAVGHVLRSFFTHFSDEDPDTLERVEVEGDVSLPDLRPCDEEELLDLIEADFSGSSEGGGRG